MRQSSSNILSRDIEDVWNIGKIVEIVAKSKLIGLGRMRLSMIWSWMSVIVIKIIIIKQTIIIIGIIIIIYSIQTVDRTRRRN